MDWVPESLLAPQPIPDLPQSKPEMLSRGRLGEIWTLPSAPQGSGVRREVGELWRRSADFLCSRGVRVREGDWPEVCGTPPPPRPPGASGAHAGRSKAWGPGRDTGAAATQVLYPTEQGPEMAAGPPAQPLLHTRGDLEAQKPGPEVRFPAFSSSS